MFFIKDDQKDDVSRNIDQYMDSYFRDPTFVELKEVMNEACSGNLNFRS
jgi:hypothetical protein